MKATLWNDLHPDDPPRHGLIILDAPSKAGDGSQYVACGGEDSERLNETARRIAALWNAAEEIGLTTEKIAEGVIQMTFAHNHERSATIEALLSRFQECMSEKIEAQRAAGRLKDQYENVSKHYSRRGEDIERLEAEKSEMVVALKTMVEMVEMNGFGKHYALDLARATIRREEK